MKSKSVELKPSTSETQQVETYDFLEYNDVNKPFDFVGLYKSAAETSKILDKHKFDSSLNKVGPAKRERTPYKNKKKNRQEPLDVTQINIDASCLNSGVGASFQFNSFKVTSTPNRSANSSSLSSGIGTRTQPNSSEVSSTPSGSANSQIRGVKSIMKNASLTDHSEETSKLTTSTTKPKKRNKSVSFMLDDNEEVDIKRTKSNDSINVNKKIETVRPNVKDKKKNNRKPKTDQQSEKENTSTNVNKQNMDVETSHTVQDKKPPKVSKFNKAVEPSAAAVSNNGEPMSTQDKKKKFKKIKKQKPETMETESNDNEVSSETKTKKSKKKKKSTTASEKFENAGDGEPASKTRKKDLKPDIAEDLENLSIGDNAHTLTNLLDEMTVIDKDKRKKLKAKFNKKKKPKGPVKEETDKPVEVKEKVKWKKRKWNKDKKGDLEEEGVNTTVVVENLPLAIMLNYKKLLTDQFIQYGLIKKIGIAEVYPTEESKPVFTTTITFYSDGAAEQALEQNNTEFEGGRIRVKRPLPATATTIVVRSYAELTDQNISSTFLGAGKIRSIRHLVKGKKSLATTFIEFHGPESVEIALKMAIDVKINGKKMHVAKFEPRSKKKKEKKPKNDVDSAADADSEDSND